MAARQERCGRLYHWKEKVERAAVWDQLAVLSRENLQEYSNNSLLVHVCILCVLG